MKKKKTYALAASMAVAGGLIVSGLSAAPAFAGNPLTCGSGQVCGWSSPNYEGNKFGSTVNPFTVTPLLSGAVSSFVNQRSLTVQLFSTSNCSGGSVISVASKDVRSNLARNGYDNLTKCVKNY